MKNSADEGPKADWRLFNILLLASDKCRRCPISAVCLNMQLFCQNVAYFNFKRLIFQQCVSSCHEIFSRGNFTYTAVVTVSFKHWLLATPVHKLCGKSLALPLALRLCEECNMEKPNRRKDNNINNTDLIRHSLVANLLSSWCAVEVSR